MTAVMLAVAAACVGFSLDASRVFLNWRTLETQADAAALAAVMELDGTAAGLARAHAVVFETGERSGCAASLEFYSDLRGTWSREGEPGAAKVRVRLTRPSTLGWMRIAVKDSPQLIRATASAEQRLISAPAPNALYSVNALNADAPDFGFRPGARYEITSSMEIPGAGGQLVPVRVLSGAPKDRELGWAAFRMAAGGQPGGTFAGAYLQGSKRPGAGPAGYYAAQLVK